MQGHKKVCIFPNFTQRLAKRKHCKNEPFSGIYTVFVMLLTCPKRYNKLMYFYKCITFLLICQWTCINNYHANWKNIFCYSTNLYPCLLLHETQNKTRPIQKNVRGKNRRCRSQLSLFRHMMQRILNYLNWYRLGTDIELRTSIFIDVVIYWRASVEEKWL